MTVTVTQISGGFHTPFRPLRLHAIKSEPDYFGWAYEDEAALPPTEWDKKYCEPEGRVIFGAFADNKLVGYTATTTWSGDNTGKTALWSMTYLLPAYRHTGAAKAFYAAREEFCRHKYDQAVMFIRDGNEHSASIHRKRGAVFWKSEQMSWNGKNPALWHWYRVQLAQQKSLAA